MALTFHTKDPDRVGDMLNISLFTDLSPSEGSEAALLTRKWHEILGGGTLTSFTNKSLLVGKKKVASISVWDEAEVHLEAWAVFCILFLGDNGVNPTTYEMFLLLEETSGVIPRLQEKYFQQHTFPIALLCLIQKYFNQSFLQTLERRKRVG